MTPDTPTRWIALLLVAATVGCSSTPEEVRRQEQLELPRPEFEHREPLGFQRAWADVPIDEAGDPDAVELAKWVTERRNAADRALKDSPMRLLQAVEVLAMVARRVPDSSAVRQRLGQGYFLGAAMWFKNADAAASSMDYLILNEELPDGTPVASQEEKEATLEEMRAFLLRCNEQLEAWSVRALREFIAYRGMRPDDKSVLDTVWKLYFFLQDYNESLRWLDAVLREWELTEVSDTDPDYRSYKLMRKELVDLIASLRIDSATRTPRSMIPYLTQSREDQRR